MVVRERPMASLALWLGVCVVACLLALVWVAAQLPEAQALERAHLQGVQLGYEMCHQVRSEAAAVREVL